MRERTLRRDDSELLVVRADQAHGGDADTLVQSAVRERLYARLGYEQRDGQPVREVNSGQDITAQGAPEDGRGPTASLCARHPYTTLVRMRPSWEMRSSRSRLPYRAQPLHRALRPFVQLVCLQPHAVRAEVLEQVTELEVLRFGVRDGPAGFPPEERPPDLRGLVRAVDVQKVRAPRAPSLARR